MREAVLTINTGSSSIKMSVHAFEGDALGERLLRANLSGLSKAPAFSASSVHESVETVPETLATCPPRPADRVTAMAAWAAEHLPDVTIRAVGHRIVHGGRTFAGPVRCEAAVCKELEALAPLAPSHQPANLAGIDGISQLWPDMPQSLSFDTAFHRHQPRVAELYALPRDLAEEGVLRFGFHGLSYAHIAEVAPKLLPEGKRRKLIVAHLGSGASLCAIENGRSVATTMGLTALDGVPMATRCGNIDPGVVLHLIADKGMSTGEVADMLYKKSGLLGLSGISGDVRTLLASEKPEAKEALDVFVYRVAREIGSLAAALQGADAIVFTAGVGENAPVIRQRICEQLAWLGADLDMAANEAGESLVHSSGSRLGLCVIPADEEIVIARETLDVFRSL
ncbi:acetate/propionate family kinase [Henriciella aquimarina]|uniref:acetate/propionate family kinase n=1 Tax=Henriciella aquimarina TaxID=545261 RepID=UPI000A079A55|nr:acetate/propionate family kinase [Henriciella aquimarina]